MQLNAILEVAIGLVFAWLVLSLAVMQVQEWIGTALSWRAKHLSKSIGHLLTDETLRKRFYDHPIIQSFSQPLKNGKYGLPSYIPATQFANTLFDLLVHQEGDETVVRSPVTFAQLEQAVAQLEPVNPKLAGVLSMQLADAKSRAESAEQALDQARAKVGTWFDDAMTRASGWYKRFAQRMALYIGLALAFSMNVDSVQIASQLWREPTVRAVLVAQAGAMQQSDLTAIAPNAIDEVYQSLSLPVGWSTTKADVGAPCGLWMIGQPIHPSFPSKGECRQITNLPLLNDGWGWVVKLVGLLISGAAAAQGAPFWFDMLKRLINIRNTGAPPPPATPAPEPPKPSAPAAPAAPVG